MRRTGNDTIKRDRQEQKGREKRRKSVKGFHPFLAWGEWMASRLQPERQERRDSHLHEELRSLAFGRKDAVREHYVKKTAALTMLFCVLAAVVTAAVIHNTHPAREVPDETLQRGNYGESPYEEKLLVELEGETEEILLPVTVQARRYTSKEAKVLLGQAREELDQAILGENESRDQVTRDLYFPTRLQEEAVSAEYLTVPYGMIQSDGVITGTPSEKGSLVEIKVTLTCQEETLIYETAVMVFPQPLTEEEELRKTLEDAVGRADEDSRGTPVFPLPDKVGGRSARWKYPGESAVPLLLLIIVIPLLVSLVWDRRIHEKALERKLEMMIDYPGLLWKMALLMGAGLTIRNTFMRISTGYSRETGISGKKRYVYEELLYTCREMQSGVPEGRSYENFGRRCDMECYVKLGTLLSQNLKKGSAGLTDLLQKEAAMASHDRTANARKLGEQAGTRMLFPMILLLGVVLVVLIAPAFMAM